MVVQAVRELPPIHVPRPRLVDLLAAARVTLVAAPGGYGKTVLAAELGARLELPVIDVDAGAVTTADLFCAAIRRGAIRAGLSDLVASLGRITSADPGTCAREVADACAAFASGLLIVVDEAQEIVGDAAAMLVALAGEAHPRVRLVLLGRALPAGTESIGGPDVVRIGAEELSFQRAEVKVLIDLVLDEPAAAVDAAIYDAGRGWPAITALAIARLARDPGVGRPPFGLARRTLAALVDEAFAGLQPEGRGVAAQLAHLPLLAPALIDAVVGEGAFDRLVRDGLPLAARRDGWYELPGRVREELAGRGPLEPAIARDAARFYASVGEVALALQLLSRTGDHATVADLIATTPLEDLDEVGPPVLFAVLALVPDDVLRANARGLLQVIRIADLARMRPDVARLLERAERLGIDGPVGLELAAERAMQVFRTRDENRAAPLAEGVLRDAGPADVLARARALQVLALTGWDEADPVSARRLEEAVVLFGIAGEARWRGEALAGLAYHFRYHTGAIEIAQRTMEDALAALPGASRIRASWLTFQGEIETYAGNLVGAEAALREAEALGRSSGEGRTLAYVAWAGGVLATVRRDAAVAEQRFELAERFGGYDPASGLLLMAEAATSLARLDRADAALRWLERAEAAAAEIGFAIVTWLPRGIYEARFGDPARAEEVLCAYQTSDERQMPPREEWRVLLERAGAALRRGDGTAAADLAARASEVARARGLAGLMALHEPALVARLAPEASAPDVHPLVQCLGEFAVSVAGKPVELAAGHPTTLVKLLAVARRSVPLDEAAESLWPNIDAETGQRRLRNVLARVRAACGELIVRRGTALALAPEVEIDIAAFLRQAAEALGADDAEREGRAAAALARYAGELLPADRYEAWSRGAREETRRRALDLIDVLVDAARERGALDDAIRLLDRALAIEPDDEARILTSAELLLVQGRRGSARTLVERAAGLRSAAGVPPSPRVERLLAATRRPAGALVAAR